MAIYYKWRRSSIKYKSVETGTVSSINGMYFQTLGQHSVPELNEDTGYYDITNSYGVKLDGSEDFFTLACLIPSTNNARKYYYCGVGSTHYSYKDGVITFLNPVSVYESKETSGNFIDYVYSTSPSAYPTNGVSGDYYYDQRTTVISPTTPGNTTYPNPVTNPTVLVSWEAASSNVLSYGVDLYEVSYSANGKSWVVAGTTQSTSMSVSIPTDATSIQFRVRAKDSNGQWGEYQTGSAVAVYLTPNLTAPNLAMQGQNITMNWTESLGATGYIVQRKSNTDGDWVQVYSGGALTFTEAVGPWSSVQYRVQAVFSGGTSGWATSAAIQVVSSSSLVISGQNGDLGTLVNDVPYTISTDTGNQITVKTMVNGAVIFDSTVPSGAAEFIPVLDLVHGTGTIVIEASVQASNGTVSAVRSWTYNKAAMTFPNAGRPSQLERNGKNIWPKTLAECVRLPGGRTLEEVTRFPAQAFYTSYTGTGTSGSGNQTHLAVPFKPQALAILDGNTGDAVLMVRPGTKVMNGNTSLTVAWSDTGVSWYSTNASNQLNATGTAYHVVVFG